MTDEPILFEFSNSIARITLNRPTKGNAIDLSLARALFDAAIRCDTDSAVGCVVLTGAGRAFCVGGDLALLNSAGPKVPSVLSELTGFLHMAVTRLARMQKPLLTLVNGPAAGAGLSLALLGDIVLAAESAHFTSAYTAIGLTPDGGLTWLLPRILGLRRAQEMILTNRRIDAAEAESIGLVTRVVSDATLTLEGTTLATRLAESPTQALGKARSLLLESFGVSIETQLEREARTITAAGANAESAEGIAAFLGKRKPDYSRI
jgi:2-(1,2-epoxy-1,2-dihydrophenyl)acetyl-CoA isomerase